MERPQDDVSWGEIGERLRIIVTVSGLLIAAELLYRWLTYPEDIFALYQEFVTWLWYNLHSMIFGSETISMTSENGYNTVIIFHNPVFEGSGINSLWVSDECVGLHEIAFVSFLIWMTPGVNKREKYKGIGVMALILFSLNMVRLLILYPLALSGCTDEPSTYGCWAGMWEFHEFMLNIGFLLVIILGWTGWFFAIGGANKVRDAERLFPNIESPASWRLRDSLSRGRLTVVALALLVALASVHTLFFDEDAQQERLEAEGCEGVISSLCAKEVRDWENISGKAWRGALVGLVTIGASVVQFTSLGGGDEEE